MSIKPIHPWSDAQYRRLGLVKLAARVDACLTASEILTREAGIAVAETAPRHHRLPVVKLPIHERGLDRMVQRLNAMTGRTGPAHGDPPLLPRSVRRWRAG